MQRSYHGTYPTVHDDAYIWEHTSLIGDVTVGAESSVWPYVCLRGDTSPTTIGARSNIQEFSMIHGATIGDRVTIGHAAVVDYAAIADDVLIGMSSAVMRGATVESNAIVAAGSVVLQGETIPAEHMAYGIPASVKPVSEPQRAEIQRVADHYVELSQEYRLEE